MPNRKDSDSRAPQLVLGPILRRVEGGRATLWVETDGPCEVTVSAGGLEGVDPTFAIEGHHYALVTLAGLEPGSAVPYELSLDGRPAWPEPGSELPPPVIRAGAQNEATAIAFGSCRISRPHEPPYALERSEHPEGHGIDALRSFALRAAGQDPEERPRCLLLLGDQIYADELSPELRAFAAARRRPGEDEASLLDFDEYAAAYREAWSEPAIRWLLSTVPVAMVFDDHDIHAEWRISQTSLERLRGRPPYERQVPDGLMAYWIYQHIGNLTPDELEGHGLLRRLRDEADGGELLRREMSSADEEPGHSRWSYRRDFGRTRLIVIDSRAGRELEPGKRRMISEGEWEWIVDCCRGDFDHVLLASSVPFFLAPGLHHGEAWNEVVSDGAWGRLAAAAGERLRRLAVMDHWAAFQRSYRELERLLEDVVTGECGPPPRSLVMLSGDVHHCYLAELGFPPGINPGTPVWQAVCSGFRKELERKEKGVIMAGISRAGELLGRALARAASIEPPRLGWRLAEGPAYENQIATLRAGPDSVRITFETPAGSDWREPRLRAVFERTLA